jgi:TDG/mug DNA glycosylase family protein
MANSDLKSLLNKFRYSEEEERPLPSRQMASNVKRVSKVARKTLKQDLVKRKYLDRGAESPTKLEDLQPSLSNNATVLFIGFNPGVQSSVLQHHYAHHSNLFWKLFNQSHLLQTVVLHDNIPSDPFLQTLLDNGTKPEHDYDIIKYNIAFTDLVLRCTKTAQELQLTEKLHNVPRLLSEFNRCKAEFIVVVGKGIWEIIIKYIANELGIKFKLTKTNFSWGLQLPNNDTMYNSILKTLGERIPSHSTLYVFPNTSGLVASLKFDEKLALWQQLVHDIESKNL